MFPGPRSTLLCKYYPALDGLRAVAIGLVFMVHFCGAFRPWAFFQWGWVGVDLFFVLSGFLITGILFDSLHRADYFRNFYIRRILRIFPLYYGVLVLIFLIGTLPAVHVLWDRYSASYWFYLANLFEAGGKAGLHSEISLLAFQPRGSYEIGHIGLGHLWSLCAEEQFYLLWPAVVWGVRSRKALLTLCVTVMALEPPLRWLYMHFHPEMVPAGGLYFPTYFRVDTLLAGAATALWMRGSDAPASKIRSVAYGMLLGASSIFFVAWKMEGSHPLSPIFDPLTVTFGFSLVALASVGLLLLVLDEETWIAGLLRQRTLMGIGRISYGMYVFHGLIVTFLLSKIAWFHRVHLPGLSIVIVGPALSIALAWLSFRYFESPFLALKQKLAPREGAIDDPPAYTGSATREELRECGNETA